MSGVGVKASNEEPEPRVNRGRHRRCRSELWCAGCRCVLAVQHAEPHAWSDR